MINKSMRGKFATELSATMDGTNVEIGSLTENPVILIFDNQSTVSVAIYVDGVAASNLWHTFPAGEAILLDCRANHGIAPNYSFDEGTTFYGNGASGTFSISYTYAKNV